MTVYRRGDKWVAKVFRNGRYEWIATFPTKKEARAAEQGANPQTASWRMTLEEFAAQWLRDYAREATASQRNYRYALARLRKDFGSRKLAGISRPEAQAWAKRVPYFAYRVARTMYADALRDGFVQMNPFAGLRIPVPQGRRHIDVLNEDEVRALADVALEVYDEHLGPTMRAYVLVAGFAGLRPGEIAELDWGDVDLEGSLLHVRHATGGVGERKDPKTEAGRRRCVLPAIARDALAQLERHAGTQAVFVTPRGARFNKGAHHRYFDRIRIAFGRPEITPYWLRHAYITAAVDRGLDPMDVARQVGHADGGNLIRRHYAHPDEQRQLDRIAMAFAEVPESGRIEVAGEGSDRA